MPTHKYHKCHSETVSYCRTQTSALPHLTALPLRASSLAFGFQFCFGLTIWSIFVQLTSVYRSCSSSSSSCQEQFTLVMPLNDRLVLGVVIAARCRSAWFWDWPPPPPPLHVFACSPYAAVGSLNVLPPRMFVPVCLSCDGFPPVLPV